MKPLSALVLRVVALAMATPLVVAPALAQGDGDQSFEGSAEVVLVEVPVRVLVEGRPLVGLSAADFEVYDRGELQEITHFDIVDLRQPVEGTLENEASPQGGRHFLFVVDLAYPARAGRAYSSSILSTQRDLHSNIRSLSEFLSSGLGPRDRWALAYHSPLRRVKLLQSWVSDPAAVEPTIELFDAIARGKPRRVEEAVAEWSSSRAAVENVPPALLPTPEDLVAEARTASVRADPFLPQLKTIQNLTDGLTELTGAIGEVTGTRHLIYLSGGFPLTEDNTSTPILNRLQQLFRDFRSSGWSIEAVNPVGVDLVGGSLFLITEETGGQLHTNSRELTELLDRIAARTAYSYVLGFNPEKLERNGRYHRLRVELVNPPKASEVVHRRGYYAPESGPESGAAPQDIGVRP